MPAAMFLVINELFRKVDRAVAPVSDLAAEAVSRGEVLGGD
jgi:hypothetical protein